MWPWLKGKLLKWLLGERQYYVQAKGLHSHFHSIFSDIMEEKATDEQKGTE